MYINGAHRPYWRGKIHGLWAIFLIGWWLMHNTSWAMFMFIIFQLQSTIMSFIYHNWNFKSIATESIIQKLDHLLICFNVASYNLPLIWMWYNYLPFFITTLHVIGFMYITNQIVVQNRSNIMSFVLYATLGAIEHVNVLLKLNNTNYTSCCALSYICNIIGGYIYAHRSVGKTSVIFGYHEVMHLLNVIGGMLMLYVLCHLQDH